MGGVAAAFPVLEFSNAIALSPSPCFSVSLAPTASTGRALLIWRKATRARMPAVLRASASGNLGSLGGGRRGTGLLERPTLDQSQFDPLPQPQQGGDMGQLRHKIGLGNGDSYKVLLIDDARHTEKLVEKALPQVVPSVTVGDARKLFHESQQKGVAVVIVTVKEHAEFYSQMMIQRGLRSAIEPDSSVA